MKQEKPWNFLTIKTRRKPTQKERILQFDCVNYIK